MTDIMTNINCSEKCIYENNGQCSLTHVGMMAGMIIHDADCAYFSPRNMDVPDLNSKKNKLT